MRDTMVESKKSSKIGLGLISLVASVAISTGFVSCKSEPEWDQYCVDKDNKVVDSRLCEQNQQNTHNGGVSPFYMWYFMSHGGGYHPVGSSVTGGTYTAPAHFNSSPHISQSKGTSSSVSKGTTSRGGFGSTGAGHSSSSG